MRLFLVLLCFLLVSSACSGRPATPPRPAETPEWPEIQAVLERDTAPPGLQFVIREADEEALDWLLPRVVWYVARLRERWPDLPIAIMAHGEEIAGLTRPEALPRVHRLARELVRDWQVDFHICGAQAADMGYDWSAFPAFIDVVPWGPGLIRDYNELGYELIDMEMTW